MRVYATLRAALNCAVRDGLIPVNPALLVKPGGMRRPRTAVWTATQTAQFLHQTAEDRLYAVFHLIALCGLRRGEAAALRWCDADLDGGTIYIDRQLQQRDGQLVQGPPKTSSSRRVVELDTTTASTPRKHRALQRTLTRTCRRSVCVTCATSRPASPSRPART